MDRRALGDITLGRLVESERPEFPLEELIPQATAAATAPHRHWRETMAVSQFIDISTM